MKWITREYVKVDRVACPWLIKKFVDKEAEFFFVPSRQSDGRSETSRCNPLRRKERRTRTSWQGMFIRGDLEESTSSRTIPRSCCWVKSSMAPTPTTRSIVSRKGRDWKPSPKAFGISAIKNDHALNAAEWIVYDALYAYCQADGERRKAER